MPIHPQQLYHSYLLRLWQVGSDVPAGQAWRASLENPHTGEILNFTSLERLFEFLEDQCSPENPQKTGRVVADLAK